MGVSISVGPECPMASERPIVVIILLLLLSGGRPPRPSPFLFDFCYHRVGVARDVLIMVFEGGSSCRTVIVLLLWMGCY